MKADQESRYPRFDAPVAVVTEELRIDGRAENLVPIYTMAVRRDGAIAIVQRQDGLIRFFSSRGEFLGTFGRHGRGPGEFVRASDVGMWGDTLWVYDYPLRRFSFISPSLELERTQTIPGAARLQLGERTVETVHPWPLAPGSEGSYYGVMDAMDEWSAVGRVDAAEGVIRDVVLPLRRPEPRSGPFRNRPVYTIVPRVARAGVATASVDGPDAGTFSLLAVDLEGDTVFARRYRFHEEEIPENVADSVLRLYTERREAATGRTWSASGVVPPVYPPFVSLVIGEDASFWIRTRQREGRRRYYVVTSRGEPMGTVSLPEGNRIAAATLDRIWVIERGMLDIESVVRYGVEWN